MNKTLGILLVFSLLLVSMVSANVEPTYASFDGTYSIETGLTVVTGTISGESVDNLPVTIYCNADGYEFVIGTAISNNQGLFSVTYNNNGQENTCMADDSVRSEIDNTNFMSPNIVVMDAGPYDYADTDISVPEFGALASLMVLGLAGLFIAKKRN